MWCGSDSLSTAARAAGRLALGGGGMLSAPVRIVSQLCAAGEWRSGRLQAGPCVDERGR